MNICHCLRNYSANNLAAFFPVELEITIYFYPEPQLWGEDQVFPFFASFFENLNFELYAYSF